MFDTENLIPISLLLLRVIIAIVFFSSGKSHLQKPVARGKSIGMSPTATSILGFVEVIGAISIAIGIYAQIGAVLLIMAMLGAIYKKIFVWKTGFYADEGFGWHYDLLLLLGAFVIFATVGGTFTVLPLL